MFLYLIVRLDCARISRLHIFLKKKKTSTQERTEKAGIIEWSIIGTNLCLKFQTASPLLSSSLVGVASLFATESVPETGASSRYDAY